MNDKWITEVKVIEALFSMGAIREGDAVKLKGDETVWVIEALDPIEKRYKTLKAYRKNDEGPFCLRPEGFGKSAFWSNSTGKIIVAYRPKETNE